MGKKIIVKGADFSANCIKDAKNVIGNANFYPRKAYAQGWQGTNAYFVPNATRAAYMLDMRSLTGYTKIKMVMQEGCEFVFTIGNHESGATPFKRFKGDGIETAFAWATDVNYVIASIDSFYDCVNCNLRYANGATVSEDAVITDFVKSLELIP